MEAALSDIQFPTNLYTILEGRNIINKQYLSLSRDELSNQYNNVEGEGNKEELEKIRNTAWRQDFI